MPPAVLLDAMGTLVRLESPVPRLAALLEAEGHPSPVAVVSDALRAEVRHYRANHLRGRDPASLAALRAECAAVLGAHLASAPPPARLLELLMASLVFRPFPEAPAALAELRRRGAAIAVVSDWDSSLAGHLADLGIAPLVDAVVVSAEVGVDKPDARIFRAALAALGAAPDEAVHCGDDPARDVAGARAAGVRPVLLDRGGRGRPEGAGAPVITSLSELPALLG